MRKIVRNVVLGATSLLPLGLLVGYAPTDSINSGKPVDWQANPPVHIKGNATSTYQSGYQPSQIRTAYGFNNVSYNGAGQTIAIVDAYGSPTAQSDLNKFSSQFGLPATTLNIQYPSGKPSRTNGGWALETSLDIEWAHSLAPAANIMLVAAKSASTTDLLTAIDYATSHGAQVVSNSWGGSEFSGEASDDSHFTHTGVVYIASAGDSGAGAEWPAASPSVLSVGGTNLQTSSGGAYGSESAWTSSGGADSAYESRPSYQNNVQSVVGSQRGIPDIAFDADPNSGVAVYDSTPDQGQSGWFVVGGTSVSAPCWAGLVALTDQASSAPLSTAQLESKLYSLAGTASSYSTDFHDVVSGSNGNSALTGYDLVTGLGTPKADALVPALKQ